MTTVQVTKTETTTVQVTKPKTTTVQITKTSFIIYDSICTPSDTAI
jgi:hypothetical protein